MGRITCTCGAFLLVVDGNGPLRLELPRCRCGVWPLVVVDEQGSIRLYLFGRRADMERQKERLGG